jgi:hypothetical protein
VGHLAQDLGHPDGQVVSRLAGPSLELKRVTATPTPGRAVMHPW